MFMREWKKWPIKIKLKNEFPEQLKNIKTCPDKLYYRGTWKEDTFDKSLVMVGSRRMTRYGKEVVAKIVPDLVKSGFLIISGFMYGIDSEAHRECVECGGMTAAVLGMGLNCLSPPENDLLYSKILDTGGVVISEFPPEMKGALWTFPQRNRIVAGLASKGVVVVEAGMKSGSLITARLGREQGKEVYAVPGSIVSPVSAGTNWLLQNNYARILTSAEELTLEKSNEQISLFNQDMNGNETRLWHLLESEPRTIDEIAKLLNMAVNQVSVIVSTLSLKNLITEESGKIYLNRF